MSKIKKSTGEAQNSKKSRAPYEIMKEALWKIRIAGRNENSTAQWMQKWSAWGLEPDKWEKPSNEPPVNQLDGLTNENISVSR